MVSGTACGSGTADPPAATAVPVTLATVVRDSLVEEITLTGRLMPTPDGSALLSAPAAGIVQGVAVRVGGRVHRGEVLMQLDVPELTAAARQQAGTLAQARREAERQRQLLADGVTSRRQAEVADAAAQAAETAHLSAGRLLAQTRIRSPITGRVQRVAVRQGERVDAGALLLEVIAPDTLDLDVAVPVDQLTRVHIGQLAGVEVAGDSATHPARVAAIAPGVDSLTNAGRILIQVPNPSGSLRAGAGAVAHVRLGVRRDVVLVPDSALVAAGDREAVFVVGADSVAHQRPVTVGVRHAGRADVRGDVRPGDRVVTVGAAGLQDGMHVVP